MDDERMAMTMMNTSDVLHSMTPFCGLCVGFTDFIGIVRWIGLGGQRVSNVILFWWLLLRLYLIIVGLQTD